jgi:Tol biopolymer transport system component
MQANEARVGGSVSAARIAVLGTMLCLGGAIAATAQTLVTRVSVDSTGGQIGDGLANEPMLSGDGRYVVFTSRARDLVPDDTNDLCDNNNDNVFAENCFDVFVHDTVTRRTVRVSVGSDGRQANGPSYRASIDATGRFVTFATRATNLAAVGLDVLLHDRDSDEDGIFDEPGAITTTGVAPGSQTGFHLRPLSAGGRFVVFVTDRTDVVPGDTNGVGDVFVRDTAGVGQTVRVSVSNAGAQADGESFQPSISHTGRYVTFVSAATNLVTGGSVGAWNVFRHDRDPDQDGVFDEPGSIATIQISLTDAEGQPAVGSINALAKMSGNGQHIVFYSTAALQTSDLNGTVDAYVRDVARGRTERLDDPATAAPGAVDAFPLASNGSLPYGVGISADGRWIVFDSVRPNPAAGDPNTGRDVYLHDRDTDGDLDFDEANAVSNTLVSVRSGNPAAGGSQATISDDGLRVAFASSASTLVAGDTNALMDVFVSARPRPPLPAGVALLTEEFPGSIARLDAATGRFLNWLVPPNSAYLRGTTMMAIGPDGLLYIADGIYGANAVKRFDPETGAYLGIFASNAALSNPIGVVFGPDGDLYVGGYFTNNVLRFDGRTGALVGTFVAPGSGGLVAPNGMAFGPSGDLFVCSADGRVLRYNGATGAFVGAFATGFSNPVRLLFTNDGRLLVADQGGASMVRAFDAATGAALGNATSGFVLQSPIQMAIRPDGLLYVTEAFRRQVVRFDAATGAFRDIWVPTVASPQTNKLVEILFLDTRGTQPTLTESRAPAGAPGDSTSLEPSLDRTGRYLAFTSAATNLVPNDTNGVADVFVRDRLTGTTTRVSVGPLGGQGNAASGMPAISADARYVAFVSAATTLVEADNNGTTDVFLHDRQTGVTRRVSNGPGGVAGNGASTAPAVSGDGRYVVFSSLASNLIGGDTNGVSDVFRFDRQANRISRVSEAVPFTLGLTAGAAVFERVQAEGASGEPDLDGAGGRIVFTSVAPLVPEDTNGRSDTYVVDVDAGTVGLLSSGPGGVPGDGESTQPAISEDGKAVVFASTSTNLVPDDTNGRSDIFVVGTETPRRDDPKRVSQSSAGGQTNGDSRNPDINSDGTEVTYESDADNVVVGDTNGRSDIFQVTVATLQTRRVSEGTSGAESNGDSTGAAMSGDGRTIAFASLGFTLVSGDGNGVSDVFVHGPAGDADQDGLLDAWEVALGLDPNSATGLWGATGDPDADGRTNAEEAAAGTHPRGSVARYLAEGSEGAFFDTRLAIVNPRDADAHVNLVFQRDSGVPISTPLLVPARSRRTVATGTLPGMTAATFGTTIESDGAVVVDRLMTWDQRGYGSHAETAQAQPGLQWYLAEGATHGEFSLFYLLQNPNDAIATVRIRYLLPRGAPIDRLYDLAPASRMNVAVDDVPGLDATDVSAVIDVLNGQPILAERAMYFNRPGQPFAAGHASAAVAAPATRWFLAEGATGRFFDYFLLLANPDTASANVTITYLLASGAPVTTTRTLPPQSRTTIYVAAEDPRLADAAVSAVVESTNGVPVIAERSMFWPQGSWHEAHNSPGTTVTGTAWALAEGEDGGPRATQTYILVANTSAFAGIARVTLFFEDGTTAAREYPLAANSRTNVPAAAFPGVANRRFGVLVESQGTPRAEIVVERAMYHDAAGVVWAAGSNAVATRVDER